MSAWDRVKQSMQALRAALDPSMMRELEEVSARMAPLEALVREGMVSQQDAEAELHQQQKRLERMMQGVEPASADLRQLFQQEPPSKAAILEAMRHGVSAAEFEAYMREQELVAAAHAAHRQGTIRDGKITIVNNFALAQGGSGGGGAGGSATTASSTMGRGGGGMSASGPPRVTQAEFVRIASQGDLANNVWLQGPGGPGDLLVLSAYQVKPEENTGNLVLVHAEAANPGATLKDSKQLLPPRGGLWWVRNVRLGNALPGGAVPVVIHVDPKDAIHVGGDGKRPAPKAVDRLRFIPEEDVLEMATKFLVRGSLNGVAWVLNDSAPNELPLLYIANNGAAHAANRPWEELFARLLLGEEE